VCILKPVPMGEVSTNKNLAPGLALGETKIGYIREDFEYWPPRAFTLIPETGDGAWLQSPVQSDPRQSPMTGASGNHGAEFDSWDYYYNVYGDMISLPVDLVGTTSPLLKFYFWNHTDFTGYGNNDSVVVSISSDNGSTWNKILTLKGNIDDWTLNNYDLNAYIGDTILVKFRGISDWGGTDMGIDYVEIGEKPGNDAGIKVILSPGSYTDPSSPLTPSCIITDVGTNDVGSFYTYLLVDSMGTVIHTDSTFVDTLLSGEEDTVNFADMSLSPNFYYTFTYFTDLSGDEYSLNDSMGITTKAYTSDRMVVGELTTNTSCNPCLQANDTLDQIISDYPNNLALIRYHCWWPSSNDPFYMYNVIENTARVNYYGADYAPHFYVDGDVDYGYDASGWRGMLLNEMQKKSPLSIQVNGIYHSISAVGSLYVTITATGEPLDSDLYLRYCLVENGLYYAAPNGERNFQQVFRDMVPDTLGVPLVLHFGDTYVDTQTFQIDSTNINADTSDFVIFVQSDESKHILQGTRISLSSITAGIGDHSNNKPFRLINLPSIIKGNIDVKFYVDMNTKMNISIFDLTGRKVFAALNGKVAKGTHKITINSRNFTSGIYFLVFEYNGGKEESKVVILK